MESLPKIVRILEITPFKITLLWNTAEIRIIDFIPLFEDWERQGDTHITPLKEWDTFKQATISGNGTLAWKNVPVTFSFKGKKHTSPLELDAQELYRQSVLLRKVESVNVGALLREARLKAGLSQTDVALKSGTSRHYISRIENEKSDIQLETFQKIVELGIGKKVVIEIQ